jgi:hypothetical protein
VAKFLTMENYISSEISKWLVYILFGFSFIVGIIPFTYSHYLWKKDFFRKCFLWAILSFVFGILLELANFFYLKYLYIGDATLFMSVSLIYLSFWQFFRQIFKRWKKTEPYDTSYSGGIGEIPTDMFSDEYKDGKLRKYEKDRKVMYSDFLFSFLQALVPIFFIMILMLLIKKLNK